MVRERRVSTTPTPHPHTHFLITHRTRDFSPVLFIILIEYNSAFKNIEPPPSQT